jgi:exopolyphosphatase/guanosine-5'-triphosphate,3'-diphosphate pyrophosphatase
VTDGQGAGKSPLSEGIRVTERSDHGSGALQITEPVVHGARIHDSAPVLVKSAFETPQYGYGLQAERQDACQMSANGRGPNIYGALDLGTNNCRLLVARPSRRGFQVIDAFSRIIRLGEGVSQTGRLSDEAMRRTMDALKICSEKMQRRNVGRSRLIATEACRVAMNGREFVERVQEETGLNIEVITRETEARLAVAGCASLLDHTCDWALVFDIGGGSTELIWLDLSRLGTRKRQTLSERVKAQSAIAAWTSLPVGVVTLAEKFGGRHVDDEIFMAMVESVLEKLIPFEDEHRFGGKIADGNAHLLGTSGTVTTIAGVHLRLECYSRSKVDGCWLTDQEIRTVSKELLSLNYDGRSKQACIGPDRADLVLAGCAILEAIMRLWPCRLLRVADRGLREGILTSLMAEDFGSRDNGRRRY